MLFRCKLGAFALSQMVILSFTTFVILKGNFDGGASRGEEVSVGRYMKFCMRSHDAGLEVVDFDTLTVQHLMRSFMLKPQR